MFTTLSRIFVTERHRQRAAEVGFSVPAFSEFGVSSDTQPFLATNMRGTWLRTRLSVGGQARFGFSECSLDQESILLKEFYRVLVEASENENWTNKASTVEEGIVVMRRLGYEPKFVVSADKSGVTEVPTNGLMQLYTELPEGAALITAHPQHTGYYTRVGEHLGVLAHRVDRAFVVVG